MLLTPYPSLEETVFLADMALSAIAEVAEEIVDGFALPVFSW